MVYEPDLEPPMTETIWQIEVWARRAADDARGRGLHGEARQAGFTELTTLRATRLYQVRGRLDRPAAELLATELFADPVVEASKCVEQIAWPSSREAQVEVHLQPGVMDPVALSALDAARELLRARQVDARVSAVRTAWRYTLGGLDDPAQVESLARQVLGNVCMDTIFVQAGVRRDALPQEFPKAPELPFEKRTVVLTDLSDDALAQLSREAHLFLSVGEMQAIRDHFAALGRDPTDLELETLAQTWSEHCVHKTLKSAVTYRGRGFGRRQDETVELHYDNLLKDTVARATRELNHPWCLSVFVDNAGVIAFDDHYGIAFKVETHNHPSAIEPYGGAATGAGGCIRDILGCGLGAKPVANTDVFCVAHPDFPLTKLPPGVLRPRRVLRGIVSGVRDYGNCMGIPTINGALYFDNRYLANPLVFCGCVGLIPRDKLHKLPRAGDKVVLVGGRTGRDGIGGATFSSAELTDTHADEFAHAVQIGNAIEEKKVLDGLLRARDHADGCLYTAVTDCGAGGLSSAVGEMAETLGARVDLETVPLKYSGLRYNEIWLSEAQERMVFAVPPDKVDRLIAVFDAEEVEATVIGEFTGDGVLTLRYDGAEVGRLDVDFLHHGIPMPRRDARWEAPRENAMPAAPLPHDGDLGARLLAVLGSINVCSRESVFRQYDQEVLGGSVVKPLTGRGEGPADAAVIQPVLASNRGIALGGGMCPHVSDRDPYWMAVRAIDEAVRNVICVGANPERIAILDNFCWGGCNDEEEMGALVRACQGCYDAAKAFETPFISGKDSLNNQFSLAADEARRLGLPERIAIPHTLLISAVGLVDDVRRCVTADLKSAGNRLVWAAAWPEEHGLAGCNDLHRAVAALIADGAVAACHDVSDGGVAVCLAEMALGGSLGARVTVPPDAGAAGTWLFDELATGYVLEIKAGWSWSKLPDRVAVADLGEVTNEPRFIVEDQGRAVLDLPVADLDAAWRTPCGLEEVA